jgi:hypothetical protein
MREFRRFYDRNMVPRWRFSDQAADWVAARNGGTAHTARPRRTGQKQGTPQRPDP